MAGIANITGDYLSTPAPSNHLTAEKLESNERTKEVFNKMLKEKNGEVNHPLGQVDFFKILSAQLANQDPLNPMEDKEFIAQMAQFSSLDQMKSMSMNLTKLSDLMKISGQNALFTGSVNLLGKEATVQTSEGPITGKISQIVGNEFPRVKVGEYFYSISDIKEIQ